MVLVHRTNLQMGGRADVTEEKCSDDHRFWKKLEEKDLDVQQCMILFASQNRMDKKNLTARGYASAIDRPNARFVNHYLSSHLRSVHLFHLFQSHRPVQTISEVQLAFHQNVSKNVLLEIKGLGPNEYRYPGHLMLFCLLYGPASSQGMN